MSNNRCQSKDTLSDSCKVSSSSGLRSSVAGLITNYNNPEKLGDNFPSITNPDTGESYDSQAGTALKDREGKREQETETIKGGDKTEQHPHTQCTLTRIHTELKLHSRGHELGHCSALCWKVVVS